MRTILAFWLVAVLSLASACGGDNTRTFEADSTADSTIGNDSTTDDSSAVDTSGFDSATDDAVETDADGAGALADSSGEDGLDDASSADLQGEDGGADVDAKSIDITPQIPIANDFDKDFVGHGNDETVTTLVQTLRPRYGYRRYLDDDGFPLVPEDEFGREYPQPGEPHNVWNPFQLSTTPSTRRSLSYFVSFGDGQLMDVKSPAVIYRNSLNTGSISAAAYEAHFDYLPQLTDAVLQVARRFGVSRTYDFAIQLGDLMANAQENELEWAIKLMSGGVVSPSSGVTDDPLPGPTNDPRDSFLANGIGVPWYAVLGNHDVLINGIWPIALGVEVNNGNYAQLIKVIGAFGFGMPGLGTDAMHRSYLPPELEPALLFSGDSFELQMLLDADELKSLTESPIVADPKRRHLSTCDIIQMLLADGGDPKGHGYSEKHLELCRGWYRQDPVPGMPLRLLVLDLNSYLGGSEGFLTPPIRADGSVIEEQRGDPLYDQIAWLQQELAQAEKDGVVVLIASHQPSSSLRLTNEINDAADLLKFVPELEKLLKAYMPDPAEAMSADEFRRLLSSYPNVIAHLAGHYHRSKINAICGTGNVISAAEMQNGTTCPTDPEGKRGYFEIIGPSPINYAPQGRIVEIVDNGDGTGSIFTTVIDAQSGPGGLIIKGRRLALAEIQATSGSSGGLGHLYDRNTELVFDWTKTIAKTLSALDLPTTIQSLTTLKAPAPGLPKLPQAPIQ
ncbi:MAG: hypothetical protein KC609_10305 [Myxococcales bacterium]|nr:hypothetical protein [Myxococcales bacterium]